MNTSVKAPRHSYAVGLVRWFISRRICHAPRRVRGSQELLLAKLSQLCGVGRTVRHRAAPKSTGALAREFIVCPRFHCEAACQSRFCGRVHRSGCCHHCAAPRVAGPLSPRGQLTPAPCIQLWRTLKKFCFSLYRQREKAKLCSF